MVDTNVVISALLKQGSVPDIVLFDVCENHELILCDQIINESYDVARRRFPNKLSHHQYHPVT
jgi:predicted nucleic acid-binding protein